MRHLVILTCLVLGACAFPNPAQNHRAAETCNWVDCQLPDCRCSSVDIPGNLNRAETPQFVLLTFDDAVQTTNINFYREAMDGRTNPNGCPITSSYYVSHEYTDYSLVHELHSKGHEIALHSITHTSNTAYWRDASVETLRQELAEQKMIMEQFALVPQDEINGVRMPFLQMAGNNQFEMMNENNLKYDCSWPTRENMNPGLWPYTLRYRSTQDCPIQPCPTESFENTWVIPMTQWDNDNNNHTCSMADACVNFLNNTVDWMKREFHRHYDSNRSPFGFYIHAAWFVADEERFEAYKEFLDYLGGLNDVFLVGGNQLIEWIKNPRPVSQMNQQNFPCPRTYPNNCNTRACPLLNEQGNERWLWNCASSCPAVYPWLGNPLGEVPTTTTTEPTTSTSTETTTTEIVEESTTAGNSV